MSEENDSKASASPNTWYLKSPDDVVEGPIETSVLSDWAAEGRIATQSEVSQDAETWMPVERLPELRMVWVAELSDGRTYGPFNLLALRRLVESGMVPTTSTLRNTTLNTRVDASEFLGAAAPILSQPGEPFLTETERRWEEMYSEEKRARALQEEQVSRLVESLKRRAEAGERRLEDAQREIRQKVDDYERLRREAAVREQELRDGLERAQNNAWSLKTRFEGREGEIQKVREEGERKAAAAVEQAAMLQSQIAALQRSHESLSVDLQSAEAELARLRGQRARLLEEQRANEAALRETDERAAQLREEAETLSAELEESEAVREEQADKHHAVEHAAAQEREELRREIDEWRAKAKAGTSEAARLKRDLETQKTLQLSLQRKRDEHEQAVRKEADQARADLADAGEELAALRAELEELRQTSGEGARRAAEQEERLNGELAELRRKLNGVTEEVLHANEALQDTRRERATLREQAEAREAEAREALRRLRTKQSQWEKALSDAVGAMETGTVELVERLREKEAGLHAAASSLEEEKARRGTMEKKIREWRDRADASSEELESLKDELASHRNLHADLQKTGEEKETALLREAEGARTEAIEAKRAVARLEKERDALRKQAEDARQTTSERDRERVAAAGRARDELARELEEARKKAAEREKELAAAVGRARESFDRQIADLEERADSGQSALRRLRAERDAEKARVEELQTRRRLLEQRIEEHLEELEGAADTVNLRLAEKEQQCETLRARAGQQATELRERVKDLTAELRMSSRKVGDAERKLARREIDFQASVGKTERVEKQLQQARRRLRVLRGRRGRHRGEAAAGKGYRRTRRPFVRPALAVAAGLLLALACAGGGYLLGKHEPQLLSRKPRGKGAPLPEMALAVALEVDEELMPIELPPGVEASMPERGGASWPTLDIPRTEVLTAPRSRTVVFDDGLFAHGTSLAEGADASLRQAAEQVRSSLEHFMLIVVGHVSGTPADASTMYPDTESLSMARARTVLDMLADRFGLPRDSMVAMAASGGAPPHGGTDGANRIRNRTVTLKIVPKGDIKP